MWHNNLQIFLEKTPIKPPKMLKIPYIRQTKISLVIGITCPVIFLFFVGSVQASKWNPAVRCCMVTDLRMCFWKSGEIPSHFWVSYSQWLEAIADSEYNYSISPLSRLGSCVSNILTGSGESIHVQGQLSTILPGGPDIQRTLLLFFCYHWK